MTGAKFAVEGAALMGVKAEPCNHNPVMRFVGSVPDTRTAAFCYTCLSRGHAPSQALSSERKRPQPFRDGKR